MVSVLTNTIKREEGHLRDYTHASNLFVTDNFRLTPKPRFLYHCSFSINSSIPSQFLGGFKKTELGVMVKSANLPTVNFEVEELNQYNRKIHNVSNVSYSPVTLTLHDDNESNVRNFLYKYYNYYASDGLTVNPNNLQSRSLEGLNAGYSENTVIRPFGLDSAYTGTGYPFLNTISVASLSKGKGSLFIFIQPTIESIDFGQHDVSDGGGIMEHTISFKYQTLQYTILDVAELDQFATGFYDGTGLSLSGALGSVKSIFGNFSNGDVVDGLIGGYQLYKQWADVDLDQIEDQLENVARGALGDALSESVGNAIQNGFDFPAGLDSTQPAQQVASNNFDANEFTSASEFIANRERDLQIAQSLQDDPSLFSNSLSDAASGIDSQGFSGFA